MSTSNAAPGVGGTAKDGGLSTAATVADGGPDSKQEDPSYAGDDGSKYEGYGPHLTTDRKPPSTFLSAID